MRAGPIELTEIHNLLLEQEEITFIGSQHNFKSLLKKLL